MSENEGVFNTRDGFFVKERKIIIFDLDGTLANIEHRRHHVTNGKNNWKAFYKACVNDTLNQQVYDVWRVLYTCGYPYEFQIFSGRSDEVRTETEEWLYKHGIVPHQLLMRKEGDYTPDQDLKLRWAWPIKEHIHLVFDDRDKVVKMWRNLGITCFQVAEGNF